jgi:hypothetical protein
LSFIKNFFIFIFEKNKGFSGLSVIGLDYEDKYFDQEEIKYYNTEYH